MTKGGKLIEGIFKGETINTPSMLAVEDYIFALAWAQKLGGLDALVARANANAEALDKIVQERDWLDHPSADTASSSTSSEERRVGKECLSPCRSRCSPSHETNTPTASNH